MSDIELRSQLAKLPAALLARLAAAGFDAERLVALAAPLRARSRAARSPDTRAGAPVRRDRDARNRVAGFVAAPAPSDIAEAPSPASTGHDRLTDRGQAVLARGEAALCVMAGGMATRMGGVVKALVEALPGETFLQLRLNENASLSSRAGAPVPLWLMTSEATDAAVRDALSRSGAGAHVRTFTQDIGLRLTEDGLLFLDDDGAPSTYATGHGDLPDALRRSGLLADFIARGGRYVWIANLDNLGATVDPALLGWFSEQPLDMMVEVAPKVPGDKGGIPVWTDARDESGRPVRRLQVLEEFRLPEGFDAASVPVFNTNTFLLRAEALQHADVPWTWFEVEKNVGGRVAVQFERLLQELTAVLRAGYVRIPRQGAASRFLPVKDHDELSNRRSEIEAVARARSMIP